MIKHRILIEIEASFHAYDSDAKNKRAKKHIETWIMDSIDRHVPIYAEKDENGSYIEDCTRKIKVKKI